MSRLRVNVIYAALASVLAIAALASCTRTASPQPSQPTATPAETATKKKDLRIITFENPRLKIYLSEWWPVEVASVAVIGNGAHKGDWIFEIRNVSDKPVKSIMMILDIPFDCQAFAMGTGMLIGLGEDNQYFTRMARPTLPPGETDKIVVQRKELDVIAPPQDLKSCPPEKSYFYLKLENVKYVDGTVWNAKKDPNAPNQSN